MTASNPAAIALITEMIASDEQDIRMTEQMLAGELYVLDQRINAVREALAQGDHIDSNWLREAAHKAEESITKRRALYANRAGLQHTLKAAGGE